jgi:biopolymer transport protein TolR
MARRTPLTSLKRMSEINLTPLMDLTFILLITFIITFPLIEHGIAVNLPTGKTKVVPSSDGQSITLDAEGSLYLNDSEIRMESLSESMQQIAAAQPMTTVYVRADESIDYGRVVAVLKILHDANITRMALVTREE